MVLMSTVFAGGFALVFLAECNTIFLMSCLIDGKIITWTVMRKCL
jgi:hypothetical protein